VPAAGVLTVPRGWTLDFGANSITNNGTIYGNWDGGGTIAGSLPQGGARYGTLTGEVATAFTGWAVGGAAPAVIDFTKFDGFPNKFDQGFGSDYKCYFSDGFYLHFTNDGWDFMLYLRNDDLGINTEVADYNVSQYGILSRGAFTESGYAYTGKGYGAGSPPLQLTLPAGLAITGIQPNVELFNEFMEFISTAAP